MFPSVGLVMGIPVFWDVTLLTGYLVPVAKECVAIIFRGLRSIQYLPIDKASHPRRPELVVTPL
jgi:hypothetical protein